MKDTGTLTFPLIHKSITEAIQNRDAQYGGFVVKNLEWLPQSVGWFNEYNGNKLVCALGNENEAAPHQEVLQIAYKWSKTKVLLEAMKAQEIDYEFIRNGITALQVKLADLNKLKIKRKTIEDSAKEIKSLVDDAQGPIGEDLARMLDSVTSKSSGA